MAAAGRPEGFGLPANQRARASGNATPRRRFWLALARQTAGLVDSIVCPIRLHYRTPLRIAAKRVSFLQKEGGHAHFHQERRDRSPRARAETANRKADGARHSRGA